MTMTWFQHSDDEMRARGRFVRWSVRWNGIICGLIVHAAECPPFVVTRTTTAAPRAMPDIPPKAAHFLTLMQHAEAIDEERNFLVELVETERARVEAARSEL